MIKKLMAYASATVMILVAASCATSPVGRIESRLVKIGLDVENAECLAYELDQKLERDELNAVADFLDGVERAGSPGEAIDALLSIDDPRAAAGVARAGLACALDKLTRR